jgi:DMSO/TMAO reductase YedYZ molybdopterin-dependent catalytic subunit
MRRLTPSTRKALTAPDADDTAVRAGREDATGEASLPSAPGLPDMTGLETHEVPEDVDPNGWRLAVDGRVDRGLSLFREDLCAMDLVDSRGEFSCVEGWTAPDLRWRGVRLTDLLDRAAPTAEARFALVHAMDGAYACGYALDRLDGALLALELDGDPLPVAHGGPARLVPAGERDCWESVKWVRRVELRATEPDGTARELTLSRLESA